MKTTTGIALDHFLKNVDHAAELTTSEVIRHVAYGLPDFEEWLDNSLDKAQGDIITSKGEITARYLVIKVVP